MIKEMDQVQTCFVGGGNYTNYTNDYCNYNRFTGNGMLLGFTVFASVAFVGLLTACCITGCNCCYRGWTNAENAQKSIDEGGGCCGGYFGRLFLNRARDYNKWLALMFGAVMLTAGAVGLGAGLGGMNENVWYCPNQW